MRVNVDSSIATDPRFKLVARDLGVSWREVIGSAVLVWFACYEQRSECLTRDEADASAEIVGFAEALVGRGLAHLDTDGTVVIHGVTARIEFLKKQAERGRGGGRESGKSRNNKDARNEANASPESKQTLRSAKSERFRRGEAYSPAPDLDLAPDLVPESAAPPRAASSKAATSKPPIPGANDMPDPEPEASFAPEAPARSKAARKARPAQNVTTEIEPAQGEQESAPPEGGHPDLKATIDRYHQLHHAARATFPTWGGRKAKNLDRLLRSLGDGAMLEVLRRAGIMFQTAPRWPAEHGGDLDTLIVHFDKFAGGANGRAAPAGKRTALDAALDIVATTEDEEEADS